MRNVFAANEPAEFQDIVLEARQYAVKQKYMKYAKDRSFRREYRRRVLRNVNAGSETETSEAVTDEPLDETLEEPTLVELDNVETRVGSERSLDKAMNLEPARNAEQTAKTMETSKAKTTVEAEQTAKTDSRKKSEKKAKMQKQTPKKPLKVATVRLRAGDDSQYMQVIELRTIAST